MWTGFGIGLAAVELEFLVCVDDRIFQGKRGPVWVGLLWFRSYQNSIWNIFQVLPKVSRRSFHCDDLNCDFFECTVSQTRMSGPVTSDIRGDSRKLVNTVLPIISFTFLWANPEWNFTDNCRQDCSSPWRSDLFVPSLDDQFYLKLLWDFQSSPQNHLPFFGYFLSFSL